MRIDCLQIAKLHAHGIEENPLTLLFYYLKNRQQTVYLNNAHSM